MRSVLPVGLLGLVAACGAPAGGGVPEPRPASAQRLPPVVQLLPHGTRLHSHNDYLRLRPLHDALAHGCSSAEADVFLVDGDLLVGHERWQLQPGRTLERLYLEPLRQRWQQHGTVLDDGSSFVLLVDIKADAARVWPVLAAQLSRHRDMLTHFTDTGRDERAVTVVLSGDRPVRQVAALPERLCAIDGRRRDLDSVPPPSPFLMPWISESWRSFCDWDGKDELLPDERVRLSAFVERVHEQGRQARWWGAPDRPESWQVQRELGVDRIGTDRPSAAAAWAATLLR